MRAAISAARNSLRRCAHAFIVSSEWRKKKRKTGDTTRPVFVETLNFLNIGERRWAAYTDGAERPRPSAAPCAPLWVASSMHRFLCA